MSTKLLIAGNPLPYHVGGHFFQAAKSLKLAVQIQDTRGAMAAPRLIQSIFWRLDRRPVGLGRYGHFLLEKCTKEKPDILLAIGQAPIETKILAALGDMRIKRLVFLTDDPWNPAHYARWFHKALLAYDAVFSPRTANINDLLAVHGPPVIYLPFAYNPEAHFLESTLPTNALDASDILFVGGADQDRVPWIEALLEAGIKPSLYGSYWEKYRKTRDYSYGHADLATIRRIVPSARINLCLVRRANRDGHVMRTFEIPAMGGGMLTEDTEEHRKLLGEEGESTLYFRSPQEMVEKAQWLLKHPAERDRLRQAIYVRITQGTHTYRDRLQTILDLS